MLPLGVTLVCENSNAVASVSDHLAWIANCSLPPSLCEERLSFLESIITIPRKVTQTMAARVQGTDVTPLKTAPRRIAIFCCDRHAHTASRCDSGDKFDLDCAP